MIAKAKKKPTVKQYKHALECANDVITRLKVKLRTIADFLDQFQGVKK